jgi:hypothetical protein
MRRTLPVLITLSLASCGGGGTSPTPPAGKAQAPARPTRFDTANAPGLTTSPQETYEQAKVVCGIKPARDIAADFDMQTASHERISARYSRGYAAALRTAAAVGCREGLAAYVKKHPGKQSREPVDSALLAQRFFLSVDNDAVKLDDAISRAQHGDKAARASLIQLQRRIEKRAAAYRRAGGPSSVGARRLVKATTTAIAALGNSDVRALVKARTAAFDAREQLTKDALNR